ncbi:MAG TPA: hypothetical protein VGF97_12235 [Rhizomicrobium sp.]
MNVISLGLIRARAVSRWDRMRETIYGRLDHILRQRLGAQDFFIQLDDISFLVTMPGSEGEDARVCCLRVAHELHTSLLGPCGLCDLELARVTGQSENGLALAPIVPPDLVALAKSAGLPELLTAPIKRSGGFIEPVSEPATEGVGHRQKMAFRFLPLWDARNEAITAYRLIGRRATQPALLEFSEPPNILKEQLNTFLSGLYHGAGILTDCLQKGVRFLMVLPIPYEVLSSPIGRMEVIATWRTLSSAFRPFLLFEVADVPIGVPQTRMNELVSTIRPFCKAVVAQAPLGGLNHEAYRNVGLQGLGVSLQGPSPFGNLRDDVERLCMAGRNLGLMTFVHDASSLDIVQFARDRGARLISGPAIAREVKVPAGMQRLAWSDVQGSNPQRVAS